MVRYYIIFILSFFLSPCFGQIEVMRDKQAVKYAETIVEKDLKTHLEIIASDEMEGRYTGSEGQKKAAEYIKKHFQAIGLLPPVPTENGEMDYIQPFNLVDRSWDVAYLRVNGEKRNFLDDFYVLGYSNFPSDTDLEVVFVGDGEEEDYKGIDVIGKAVAYIDRNYTPSIEDFKPELAYSKGAKTVFVIFTDNDEQYKAAVDYNAYYLNRGVRVLSNPSPTEESIFYLSPHVATEIFGMSIDDLLEKKEEPNSVVSSNLIVKTRVKDDIYLSSENVLGFLEGSEKPNEVLVLTAHYDHVGMTEDGEVFNGADDDGSGTSSILEIAEAFMEAKKKGKGPKRSILFMTVVGEELGLYGSSYYADINPIFPLENTVCNLNIDMVGRIGGDYVKKNDPNYVYLIGSDKLSQDLHQISEAVNEEYIGIKLDYKYNDENDPNRFYYRSDHYNFAKNEIPIIFYFNGTHEDYHQTTDTVDKIHFPKLETIARLVFYTAWEIANREERIKVD